MNIAADLPPLLRPTMTSVRVGRGGGCEKQIAGRSHPSLVQFKVDDSQSQESPQVERLLPL